MCFTFGMRDRTSKVYKEFAVSIIEVSLLSRSFSFYEKKGRFGGVGNEFVFAHHESQGCGKGNQFLP